MLLVLVIANMLPVAALLAYTGYQDYQQTQELAAQTAMQLAEVTAQNVEAFLAETRLTMSRLANRPGIRRISAAHCDSVFFEFKDLYPQFANFSQANLDGELICSTSPQPGGKFTVIRDTVWFKRVTQTRDFVIAPPHIGLVTGKVVAVLAHPVRDDAGRMVGSIQLPIDLLGFKPIVSSSNLPRSTIVTLFDSTGTIVARSQDAERFVGTMQREAPIIATILSQRYGTARSKSVEGVERIYGFRPIKDSDWYVLAGISAEAVFKDAKAAALRNTVGGLAIFAFVAWFALYTRRLIVTPVLALRQAAQQVADGALDVRVPEGGPTEIADVARQFNAMLAARARQERALASSEADFRVLFEVSLEGILRTVPNGTILNANPAACAMFRMTEAQLCSGGRAAIAAMDDPRLVALLNERALNGRARGELTLIRGDGSRFECELSSTLYTAADGTIKSQIFIRDLTDRIQQETLRAGKEAAELANREKSVFLARMSHELRTPLNAILGFSQLLELDAALHASEKTSRMSGHINAAGTHLLALIDEVLDLARIEAGALAISPETLDVERLIRECMALTAPMSERCTIRMDYSEQPTVGGKDEHCWIRADRTRLRQVLVNVFSNAIKYNRAGGAVHVRLHGTPETVCIDVQDTGLGLSEAQQANLFQAFNRLGAEQGGVEGTGLGLVIVKQLLEAMGARIEVRSTLGQGSTFSLHFDRSPPPAVAHNAVPTTIAAAALTAPHKTVTLLYVEDNPANLDLIREVLTLRPHIRLETAPDGLSGLAAANRLRPDLILLDINLPDIDGFEVLLRLRAQPATADLRCLALSANAMQGETERARAAGFIRYIVKPFAVSQLLGVLDELLT